MVGHLRCKKKTEDKTYGDTKQRTSIALTAREYLPRCIPHAFRRFVGYLSVIFAGGLSKHMGKVGMAIAGLVVPSDRAGNSRDRIGHRVGVPDQPEQILLVDHSGGLTTKQNTADLKLAFTVCG